MLINIEKKKHITVAMFKLVHSKTRFFFCLLYLLTQVNAGQINTRYFEGGLSRAAPSLIDATLLTLMHFKTMLALEEIRAQIILSAVYIPQNGFRMLAST